MALNPLDHLWRCLHGIGLLFTHDDVRKSRGTGTQLSPNYLSKNPTTLSI